MVTFQPRGWHAALKASVFSTSEARPALALIRIIFVFPPVPPVEAAAVVVVPAAAVVVVAAAAVVVVAAAAVVVVAAAALLVVAAAVVVVVELPHPATNITSKASSSPAITANR